MENYIVNRVFMLIITMAISLNAGYANEGGAAPKAVSYARIYCESFCDEPVHRVTGLGESLTRINLFTDTGERYRRYFYYGPGWIRRLSDSLLQNLERDSALLKYVFPFDSLNRGFRYRLLPGTRDNSIEIPNMIPRKSPRWFNEKDFRFPERTFRPPGNSQSVFFRNTDENGITSKLQLDISDPSEEQLRRADGWAAGEQLNVENLSISPGSLAGSLNVMFMLTGKGAVKLKVLDRNFQTISSDKPSRYSGGYIGTVSLPQDGIYFLIISQNNRSLVKRLIRKN